MPSSEFGDSKTSRFNLTSVKGRGERKGPPAGSRWLESGVPLHEISYLLGHSDLKTTSIYLNATAQGVRTSLERFEAQRLQGVASSPSEEPPPPRNECDEPAGKMLVN